jgi:hypothetical protein
MERAGEIALRRLELAGIGRDFLDVPRLLDT